MATKKTSKSTAKTPSKEKVASKAKTSAVKSTKPKADEGTKAPSAAKASKATKTPKAKAAAAEPEADQRNGSKVAKKPVKITGFLRRQKARLLALHDAVVDSMSGVAQDNLRSRAEGSEASAFGMHQADAGSDSYDRDFALSLLSQEQDALHEIDEALQRIEDGTYGVCQMSGKKIPQERLEAIPFARFTVECQSQIERQQRVMRTRKPVTSLFGLTDSEAISASSGNDDDNLDGDKS